MSVPSLDSLVLQLLEISNVDYIQATQVRTLVAQLPAAAAAVRNQQPETVVVAPTQPAANEDRDQHADVPRTGPCSCGLADEVSRLVELLHSYVVDEPTNKKGSVRKRLGRNVERLTTKVARQKKEMNAHLIAAQKQTNVITNLHHDLHSAKAKLIHQDRRLEEAARRSAKHVQFGGVTAPAQPAQRLTAVEARTPWEVLRMTGEGGAFTTATENAKATAPDSEGSVMSHKPRLNSQYPPCHMLQLPAKDRETSFTRTVGTELQSSTLMSAPVVNLPSASHNTSQAWSSDVSRDPYASLQHLTTHRPDTSSGRPGLNFPHTMSNKAMPGGPSSTPVAGLLGPSKKRPATEGLSLNAPKRFKVKADFGYTAPHGIAPARRPVCQCCRASGTQCNHQSRCAECDLRISPCIYLLCDDLEGCKDPSCDYLHDNQWDAKASPVWLIQGVNTFSDDPACEASELAKAMKQYCPLDAGDCDSEDDRDAEEGCEATVLDYGEAS